MNLKDARKSGIEYCKANNCNYTCISHDDTNGFYLTSEESKKTVFFVNKNGSLNAYLSTKYAVDFHKELKRRKKNRRNDSKRKISEIVNRDSEEEV